MSDAAGSGGTAPFVLLLNGPNLNLLGSREPQLYGATTLAEIEESLHRLAAEAEPPVAVESVQSNHEGALIDAIQDRGRRAEPALGSLPPKGDHEAGMAHAAAIAVMSMPCDICRSQRLPQGRHAAGHPGRRLQLFEGSHGV